MERQNSNSGLHKPAFNGKGGEYFGILIINWLLSLITLSVYYPWAKARSLKYLYKSSTLNNESFSFEGTGKEMFIGYLKIVLIVSIILVVVLSLVLYDHPVLAVIFLYILAFAIVPLAIHGSVRYRLARTTWHGIRFSYGGKKSALALIYLKGILLCVVTLGFYTPWFIIKLTKYMLDNARMGDATFKFSGNGGDFFILNLKGYVLTLITLGVFSFWWKKDIFNYFTNNISLHRAYDEIQFNSSATGGEFFKLLIVNALMTIFSLGIAYPWARMRYLKYIFSRIHITGNIDPDSIRHSGADSVDATGEDIVDFLDIDII